MPNKSKKIKTGEVDSSLFLAFFNSQVYMIGVFISFSNSGSLFDFRHDPGLKLNGQRENEKKNWCLFCFNGGRFYGARLFRG